MPRYTIYVNILPHEQILDPAGKATLSGLHQLGFTGVADVRIGKRIRLQVEAADRATAEAQARKAADELLVNRIVEGYTLEVVEG
jgi:phosphoribosylformylglycinamidine synthase subunit PurS